LLVLQIAARKAPFWKSANLIPDCMISFWPGVDTLNLCFDVLGCGDL